MLRLTRPRKIKPFLHAFSPGVRPSEKGNLYRNNNQNAHARVASIQGTQRTWKEAKIFQILMFPDQVFLILATSGVALVVLFVQMWSSPSCNRPQSERWFMGGYNKQEHFQRSSEMSTIFEYHKELIENTLAEAEMPEVFQAPVGYNSPSGRFSRKNTPTTE